MSTNKANDLEGSIRRYEAKRDRHNRAVSQIDFLHKFSGLVKSGGILTGGINDRPGSIKDLNVALLGFDVWKDILQGSYGVDCIRERIDQYDLVLMTENTKDKILDDNDLVKHINKSQPFYENSIEKLLDNITVKDNQMENYQGIYETTVLNVDNLVAEHNKRRVKSNKSELDPIESFKPLIIDLATARALNCNNCDLITLNPDSFILPPYRDKIYPRIGEIINSNIEDIELTLNKFERKKYKRLYAPAQLGERSDNSKRLTSLINQVKREVNKGSSLFKRGIKYEESSRDIITSVTLAKD